MTTYTTTYGDLLIEVRSLIEDDTLAEGLDNEYLRGQVDLLASVFGVVEMDTSVRMDQVLADLRKLPSAFIGSNELSKYGITYEHDPQAEPVS